MIYTDPDSVLYRKTSDLHYKIFPNSVVTYRDSSVFVEKGTAVVFSGGKPDRGIAGNVNISKYLYNQRGGYNFYVLSIPDKMILKKSTARLRFTYNGNDEYSHEIPLKFISSSNFSSNYGFFSAYSLTWSEIKKDITISCEFDNSSSMEIYIKDNVDEREFLTQVIRFSPRKSSELVSADRKKYREEQRVRWEIWAGVSESFLSGEYFDPLPDMSGVTSLLGMVREWRLADNKLYSRDVHLGIDYRSPTGTPVYNAAKGSVAFAGMVEYLGNNVIIDHGFGVYFNYSHLDTIAVKPEQYVKPGDVIGTVGMTGASTGPHLHWELRIHGFPVDPLFYKEFVDIINSYH